MGAPSTASSSKRRPVGGRALVPPGTVVKSADSGRPAGVRVAGRRGLRARRRGIRPLHAGLSRLLARAGRHFARNTMSPYHASTLSPVLSVSVNTATPVSLPGSSLNAFLYPRRRCATGSARRRRPRRRSTRRPSVPGRCGDSARPSHRPLSTRCTSASHREALPGQDLPAAIVLRSENDSSTCPLELQHDAHRRVLLRGAVAAV